MNREFIKNMILAKQYERDAFLSLLSPSIAQHVQVIEKEVKAIIFDIAKEWAVDVSSAVNDAEKEKADGSDGEKKVRKVTIT
ncbi:hypothetical protein [Acetobacterium malicum]|uniref:Uncharacterized protein n=1 Tax=Acetobacterium malicum TaxID=52692 RepID=A0ABR6YYV2_9FIRM|nr:MULTISPECIES: hypothetical protein [Acetobacterium]MBC3900316.1 hypothetical protein [Acetobacterium malicum]